MSGWRFQDTGTASGAVNMRYDELLARRLASGTGTETLRVYRWKPWAVSLGYHQNEGDIDAARCARDGLEIVRRPTGGRAILHAEELTYCIVMNARGRSVLQAYNDISRALVRGLAAFGVDAALQKSQPDFPSRYRDAASVPCFTSSARYEIEWKGRKLVGSAQRRYAENGRDVILQHGSILCGPAHRRLSDYLSTRNRTVLEQIRQEMAAKTVDVAEILGEPVDTGELAGAVREGFEAEWGLTFDVQATELSPEEYS